MESKSGSAQLSVIVCEDDDEFREQILLPGLRDSGFQAEGAESAMALYRALSFRSYDLIVVDVGLPDEDGFSVVRHLRQLGSVGIVMLTARGDSEDRVRGLDDGADAYLSKPVDMAVLNATLRSVQRRIRPDAPMGDAVQAASGWRLASQGWKLLAPDGVEIPLSNGERLFMGLLAEAGGIVVAREDIIAHLSGNDPDFDPHRIEALVHRLRRKVQMRTMSDFPLSTVRGIGYLLLL